MIKIEQVEQSLQVVQAILEIQDWRITPYIATQDQLKELLKDKPINGNTIEIFGCILIHADFRTAELYIWDNLDTSKFSQGLEHTIFHECIHIILCRYDELFQYIVKGSPPVIANILYWTFSNLEERTVNQLSDGYINSLRVIQANMEVKNEPKKKKDKSLS